MVNIYIITDGKRMILLLFSTLIDELRANIHTNRNALAYDFKKES